MMAWSLYIPLFAVTTVTAFDLVREYSGPSFFDGWDFYGSYDNLTNGDVNWVNESSAFNENLVQINAAQNVIIRVDNSSNVPWNFKRDTVRITSKDTYDFGSLWVFDVIHLPWGCSVWPAIWSKGVNWPEGGEIDIVEGVNLMTQNQVALHTVNGCFQASGTNQRGTSGADANCSVPAGCTVLDTTGQASFGQGFAQSGGGVWATQFDVAGVFVWFWNRTNLPDTLKPAAPADNLDISNWGPPTASYPSVLCNMSAFFGLQQLVIDITLCGDWAGLPVVYGATCANEQPNTPAPSGVSRNGPTCYLDNVPGPGSPRYDEAYFEISHIRAYTTRAPPPTQTAAPTPGSATENGDGDGNVTISINGSTISFKPNTDIPNVNTNAVGSVNVKSSVIAFLMGFWGAIIGVGLVV